MEYTSELMVPNELSKLHKFSANARFIGTDGSDVVWLKGILPWSNGEPVIYGIRRILPMRGGYDYQSTYPDNFNLNNVIERPLTKRQVVDVFFRERFEGGGLGRMDIDSEFAESLFKVYTITKYSKYTVGDAFENVSWSSIREITKVGSVVYSKDKRFQIDGGGYSHFYIRMFNKKRTRVYVKDLHYNEFWDLYHCTKNITFDFNKDKFLELEPNKLFNNSSLKSLRAELKLKIVELYGSIENFERSKDSEIKIKEFLKGELL